jgi:hypothetical protein
VTAQEFQDWLVAKGCTLSAGRNGHVVIDYNGRMATMFLPGNDEPLGSLVIARVKRALGLDQD